MKQFGFSLIELMISVAIVAILAAVALPSYQEHVLNTWRATATGCLLELGQGMERRFATATPMSYAIGAADWPLSGCTSDLADRYTFALPVVNGAGTTYTITAVPKGAQSGDSKCGTLGINNLGVRSETGSKDVAYCWQ